MSNEKLVAEQGREFDFEAIGDAIDRVLAGQRELTPAEQKNLRGIYSKLFTKLKPEQAYHARGAGRELLDETFTLRQILNVLYKGRTMVNFSHVPSVTRAIDWLNQDFRKVAEEREPGADIGTTPPEGLTLDPCGCPKHQCFGKATRGSGLFCEAVSEEERILAATQRAPVEQGRPNDVRAALQALGERLAGKAFPLTPHDTAEPCITLCDFQDECKALVSSLAAAPDHAREGATMKCPKCGIDVFAHGETCPVSREGALRDALEKIIHDQPHADTCGAVISDSEVYPCSCWQKLVKRALADGKEGGE